MPQRVRNIHDWYERRRLMFPCVVACPWRVSAVIRAAVLAAKKSEKGIESIPCVRRYVRQRRKERPALIP